MTYRVELDREKCIGCMACTSCENFRCGEDFKAYAVRTEVSQPGCNREAAELCPVDAIVVFPATAKYTGSEIKENFQDE